jgi:hypothetical protein
MVPEHDSLADPPGSQDRRNRNGNSGNNIDEIVAPSMGVDASMAPFARSTIGRIQRTGQSAHA